MFDNNLRVYCRKKCIMNEVNHNSMMFAGLQNKKTKICKKHLNSDNLFMNFNIFILFSQPKINRRYPILSILIQSASHKPNNI